ncbi:SH3 domain-containing protein [Georgenia satyanarayanai]|uniref:hypothetical protein n=1 Tax=Georgenia satyanarayanai TaxID=860221 RepID=UPI0012646D1B|nr:hypothetical protein [Georgenia satyanarayanai]
MRRTLPAVILAAGLLLTACGTESAQDGPGEEPTSTAASPSEPSTEPSTEEPTSPEEPSSPEPTGPEAPADTGAPAGELPGEVVDIPPLNEVVAVIGVAAGSGLNLRHGPGTEFESVGTLDPLAVSPAHGEVRRREDGSHWAQVMRTDGWFYWVNMRYIAFPGQSTDITADLPELPSAATVEEAGLLVARQRTADQPPSVETVVVDGPVEGDAGEVVIDVVGLGDDALAGERLRVVTERTDQGHTVRSVELTLLCARGATEDGLCE